MKKLVVLIAAAMLATSAVTATAAEKQSGTDQSKAKDTVDRIRQADPPQVSTTTKPSPVGQPVRDYKPTGPSVHPKEPPAPTKGSK